MNVKIKFVVNERTKIFKTINSFNSIIVNYYIIKVQQRGIAKNEFLSFSYIQD